MPQMRIGGAAADFGALHIVAVVFMLGDGLRRYRLGEARPAAARLEFVGGRKQGLAANDIDIQTRLEQMVVFMAERVFRGGVLGDFVLLAR